MSIKAFFVEALGQALELELGTPDDVLHHITPELLAKHLPRPLWARLFTACLGAPKVDAQLVVETIGIPNLCEHIPSSVIWQIIAEIASRTLGQPYVAPAVITSAAPVAPTPSAVSASGPVEKRSVLSPPPEAIETPAPAPAPSIVGPSIPAPVNQPLADLITELEQDERPITPTRSRTQTSQRFRQSNTGIGRLGANQARRPQAVVPTPAPAAQARSMPRRGSTEVEDADPEGNGEWRGQRELPVDDSQLVDWQSTETTQASHEDDFSDIGRKR